MKKKYYRGFIFLLIISFTGASLSSVVANFSFRNQERETSEVSKQEFGRVLDPREFHGNDQNIDCINVANQSKDAQPEQSHDSITDLDSSRLVDVNPVITSPPVCKTASISGISTFLNHPPILIDGNTDFSDTASSEEWDGTGTGLNPFIISGYNLTGTGSEALINISNTNYFFKIENNLLVNGSAGIYLNNVINGEINGNYLTDMNVTAIWLFSSSNNTLDNNTVTGSTGFGIDIEDYSYNNTMINNTVTGSGYSGINIGYDSENNTIIDSTLTWNDDGISIYSANTTVLNCTITNTQGGGGNYGIYVYFSCHNINLKKNTIINNNGTGIMLSNSNLNCRVNDNFIENNSGDGMILDISDSIVTDNIVVNNNLSGIGIYSGSTNNIITNNVIINSTQFGIFALSSDSSWYINNTVDGSGYDGLWFLSCDGNSISNNNFTNSGYRGIDLSFSDNNVLSWNIVTGNALEDIFLETSEQICHNSVLYRNTFGLSHGFPEIAPDTLTNGSVVPSDDILSFAITSSNGTLFYSWNEQATQALSSPYDIPLPLVEGNHALEVRAYDSNNNSNLHYYGYYINYAPEFQSTPDGESFSYYHQVQWIVSDLNPASYTIYRNGSPIDTGSFEDDDHIILDLAGYAVGVYNLTVVANDVTGLQTVDVSIINVMQYVPHDPISIPTGNMFPMMADSEGWPGNGTAVNPFIISGYNFTGTFSENLIFILDTTFHFVIEHCFLTSGDNGILCDGGTQNGIIRYNIIRDCSSWGIIVTTCSYMTLVDNVVQNCSIGGLGLVIGFSTISNNTVTNNGFGLFIISSGLSQVTNNTISGNDNGIVLTGDYDNYGIDYSFNMTISGNYIHDNILVGLNATGAINNTITGNYFENNQGYGILFHDSTLTNTIYNNSFLENGNYPSQALDNGTDNSWFNSSLNEGNLWYDYSGSGNYFVDGSAGSVDIFPITVLDIGSPAGFSISLGEQGYYLIWIQSSESLWNTPFNYTVYRNETRVDFGDWTGSTVIHSLDGISASGIYNFTLFITYQNNYGYFGNFMVDIVWITVLPDTTPPVIYTPGNITIEEGSIGYSIVWSGDENNPYYVTVVRNTTVVYGNTWYGENITVFLDGLTIGVYNYTCTIYDIANNAVSGSVIVNVTERAIDFILPVISAPAPIEYLLDTTGHYLIYNASDDHPKAYEVFINGTGMGYYPWHGGNITISVDNLGRGTWIINVTVFDLNENNASAATTVNVFSIPPDTVNPSVSQPVNIEIGEYMSGSIVWDVYDDWPGNYSIFRNATLIQQGYWGKGIIRYSFSSLPVGTWEFNLVVNDLVGNTNSSSVIIRVLLASVYDTASPQISQAPNQTIQFGETGNYVDFYLFDEHPHYISVTLNSTLIYQSSWFEPNQKVKVYLEDLRGGIYILKITAIDVFGNTATRTIMITVEGDTNSPITTSETTTTISSPGFELATIIPLLLLIPVISSKKRNSRRKIR